MNRIYAATITVLTGLAVLAACAAPEAQGRIETTSGVQKPSSSASPATSPMPSEATYPVVEAPTTPDQSTWVLPTDPYFSGQIATLEAQALDTLRMPCMHERGWSDFTVGFDASAPRSPTDGVNETTTLFNEELAAEFGYRRAPDPRNLLADQIAAAGGDLWGDRPKQFWQDLSTCDTQADAVLYPDKAVAQPPAFDKADTADDNVASLLNRLHVDTSQPQLQEAAAAWRECMAPLGIPDLPAEPWTPGNYPPESLIERWNWETTGQPSADEIQVATHDAQCRRSSGWFDRLYEADWNLREQFVKDNKADLDPILAKNQADRERYIAIINGQTPEH